MTKMKCADCKEEILAANVNLCPYCKSRNLVPSVSKEVNIPIKMAKIAKLEKAGRYTEAAREYETLGMQRKAGNCRRLAIVEAAKLEKARQYEKAARAYEDLEMWEKAFKCIRLERTSHAAPANVNVGKVASISMNCPHCNSSQPLVSKSKEVACLFCKKNYSIPQKVLDLL